MNERRDWLCEACDWIGSPDPEPGECPSCGEVDLIDITEEGEQDRRPTSEPPAPPGGRCMECGWLGSLAPARRYCPGCGAEAWA